MRTGTALALARDLESRVLAMRCKGLCVTSCGPFRIVPVEDRVIRGYCAERGIKYHALDESAARREERMRAGAPFEEWACPYLVGGRCGIHPVRPSVCRLWGANETMPCPYGCEPPGGHLTFDEALLVSVMSFQFGQMVAEGSG